MKTKFLSTLKLAHINSWEWDLNTKDLHLINAADQEEMRKISPLMAADSVTIPNYPEVLFTKNLVRQENAPLVRKYEKMILEADAEEEVSFRLPFRTFDDNTIWIQFFGKIIGNKNDKDHRAVGYYTDITKQIEIAKKSYDFDAIHEAYDNIYAGVLFGLSADYSNVFWIDLDTEAFKPIRLDPTSEKLVGSIIEATTSYKVIVSHYIEHFVFEDDKDKIRFLLDTNQVQKIMADRDIYTQDYRSTRMNETVYCQVKLAKGNIQNRNTITVGFKNIDEQYRSRMVLDYDSLTGLYNRNAFFRYMQTKMNENPDKAFNLLISDIENFKRINDLYGEKKGDEVLKFVGGYLKDLSKIVPDSVFGRYSGDQFIGLFMVDKNQTISEMDNINILSQGMEQMYMQSPIGHFETKFGMYFNIDPTLSPTAICDRALMALRSIKHKYNNIFAIYDNQMEQAYQRELRILENMEEALNTNQFKVYYQPKHDCKTGALMGAEALVRWEHPEYGFMSPAEFIPLFEKNGFITSLDLYMLKQIYKDQMEIHNMGLPIIPVSFNASRLDLLHPTFVDNVIEFLKGNKIDPSWFHVEVTENIFMKDEEILCPKLNKLRDIGMQIELDDFGSGYSSLSLLSSLPLDVIKLDMGMIRNLDEHIHVVEASIRLAHVLGYKTTAEGVEDAQQMNKLKNMGCDSIQGYYFSKPLPAKGYFNYIKMNNN